MRHALQHNQAVLPHLRLPLLDLVLKRPDDTLPDRTSGYGSDDVQRDESDAVFAPSGIANYVGRRVATLARPLSRLAKRRRARNVALPLRDRTEGRKRLGDQVPLATPEQRRTNTNSFHGSRCREADSGHPRGKLRRAEHRPDPRPRTTWTRGSLRAAPRRERMGLNSSLSTRRLLSPRCAVVAGIDQYRVLFRPIAGSGESELRPRAAVAPPGLYRTRLRHRWAALTKRRHVDPPVSSNASAFPFYPGIPVAPCPLCGRVCRWFDHRERRVGEKMSVAAIVNCSAPSGIRTRATALKGPRPGPLVDGGGEAQRN
jgi:hypothetical protein